MAKRIKVNESNLPKHPGLRSRTLRARKKVLPGQTAPSSTRKKLVKPGNRKFIGPRQLSSELAEDTAGRHRAGGEVMMEDQYGDAAPEWVWGRRYASIQPNKRKTPLERAESRTRRRQNDLSMVAVDGIDYIPKNLKDLIKSKIEDRSSQDRMFKVLARALRKCGAKPSSMDLTKDVSRAYDRGEAEYPF
jgi:hypothetical protein